MPPPSERVGMAASRVAGEHSDSWLNITDVRARGASAERLRPPVTFAITCPVAGSIRWSCCPHATHTEPPPTETVADRSIGNVENQPTDTTRGRDPLPAPFP